MAQLKSTTISGNLAVTGEVVAPNVDATNLKVESIEHPEVNGTVQLGKVSLGENAASSGKRLLQKDVATGTIEQGPAFGSSSAQFLLNNGTWAEPTGTSNKANTKLYLAGATSQSNHVTTYSNKNCYIGTDNCLYSGGEIVATQATLLASLTAIENKLNELIGGNS